MSNIITIASQKGGVGKTTTALNLGYSLGRFGGKTLIIDLDPQNGMAIASNLRNYTTRGLIDYLKRGCDPAEIIAEARDGSISVVGMGDVDPVDVRDLEQASWNGVLGEAIQSLARDFHYVFLDAPAGIGALVQAGLRASDGALLVATCCPIAFKSLPAFLKLVDHVAEHENPRLHLEGVLLSMVDERSPTGRRVFDEIQQGLPEGALFRTIIPYDEFYAAASLDALPAVLVSGAERLARLYIELAIELRERRLAASKQSAPDDGPPRLF